MKIDEIIEACKHINTEEDPKIIEHMCRASDSWLKNMTGWSVAVAGSRETAYKELEKTIGDHIISVRIIKIIKEIKND